MILPLALIAGQTDAAPKTITIPYKPVAGETATYTLEGTVPFQGGEAEFKGEVEVRTLSVARRGGAKFRFTDHAVAITVGGKESSMPDPKPYTIEVDRLGFAKKDPKVTAFSGLGLLLLGVPTGPITINEEFEFGIDGFLASASDRHPARWVSMRDGGPAILIQVFHGEEHMGTLYKNLDPTNGRLILGQSTVWVTPGKPSEGKFYSELKLVSVTRAPDEN